MLRWDSRTQEYVFKYSKNRISETFAAFITWHDLQDFAAEENKHFINGFADDLLADITVIFGQFLLIVKTQ